MGFFSHSYCCVAIPLYNVGIYLLLAEQLTVAFVIGVLCIAAPTIIAVDIPSFGPYILSVLCFLVAIIQLWGAWGVYKEKPKSFRIFARVNGSMILLAMLLALVWIVLSLIKHNDRTNACVTQFSSANSSLSGKDICSIFLWVQTGVMMGLWLMCFLAQLYFVKVTSVYGQEQRIDHKKYNSIYSAAGEELARQSMMWDSRVSTDDSGSPIRPFLGHLRNDSSMSKSSLRNEVEAEDGSLAAINKQLNRRSNLATPTDTRPQLAQNASAYHSAMYEQPGHRESFDQQPLHANAALLNASQVKNGQYSEAEASHALYGAAAQHMQSQSDRPQSQSGQSPQYQTQHNSLSSYQSYNDSYQHQQQQQYGNQQLTGYQLSDSPLSSGQYARQSQHFTKPSLDRNLTSGTHHTNNSNYTPTDIAMDRHALPLDQTPSYPPVNRHSYAQSNQPTYQTSQRLASPAYGAFSDPQHDAMKAFYNDSTLDDRNKYGH